MSGRGWRPVLVSGIAAPFRASWDLSRCPRSAGAEVEWDSLQSDCSGGHIKAIFLKSVWLSWEVRQAWQGACTCVCLCGVCVGVYCTQSLVWVRMPSCVWVCVQWVWLPGVLLRLGTHIYAWLVAEVAGCLMCVPLSGRLRAHSQ